MGRAPQVYLSSPDGVCTVAAEGGFFPLGIPAGEVESHTGTGSRTGGRLEGSCRAGGKLGATPGAHLDGILPGVVLGQQLVPVCVQLVDGLLLLLQLPMDEVLDGESQDTEPHDSRADPGCVPGPGYSEKA